MNRCRGFSVVELLVAFTVLSVILTAGYGSLRAAMRVFHTQKNEQIVESNTRLCWRFLSRDLRCAAIDFQGVSGTFVGNEHSVSFFTAVPAYVSTMSVISPVSYAVDTDPSTPEEGLVRSTEGTVQPLAPLARQLTFKYFDGKTWHPDWGINLDGRLNVRQRMLPVCVRIEFEIARPDDPSQAARFSTTIPVCARLLSDMP